MAEDLKTLQEYSRQASAVGRPAQYVYDQEGGKLNLEMVTAGAQLRIAEALEQQMALLEQAGFSLPTTEGYKVEAQTKRGGKEIWLTISCPDAKKAETLFSNLKDHLQAAVEQEGGQDAD